MRMREMTPEARREKRLEDRVAVRDGNLETARAVNMRTGRKRSRTAQAYLLALTEEIGTEDVKAVAKDVIRRARGGDQKALDWLGKFVFGNGKVCLSDLTRPGPLAG